MQFIQGNNHQTYFSTLEDQVSADNPVRPMNALINKLDLQNLGFTGTVHKSEAIKKLALYLLANPTTKTDNSITSRLRRLLTTSLSFLDCWAKRKLSYSSIWQKCCFSKPELKPLLECLICHVFV